MAHVLNRLRCMDLTPEWYHHDKESGVFRVVDVTEEWMVVTIPAR